MKQKEINVPELSNLCLNESLTVGEESFTDFLSSFITSSLVFLESKM